jgi:molybdate transport system substrate-binding protein
MNNRFNLFSSIRVVAFAFLAVVATAGYGRAADITFLSSNALQSAMEEVLPEFEKASGHNIRVTYAAAADNAERVRKGERVDLAVVTPEQWEDLRKEGKLGAASRVVIGRIGIGAFVNKGAARPDMSSEDALKRTLLNARSIAVGDPSDSPVGKHVVALFDRLGVGNDIKPKLRLTGAGQGTIQAVARGDAEIGFAQMTEIMGSADVASSGLLPAILQAYVTFTAAIPASGNQAAAQALVGFLTSSRAVTVLKSRGFECGIGEANEAQPLSCILGPPGDALKLLTRPEDKARQPK